MPTIDATVENHGSLILIRPHNESLREWLQSNVQADAQWFGEALVVEPRYAGALCSALNEEGFVLN